VLVDAAGAFAAIEGEPALRYMPPTGLNVPDEHVFRFRFQQEVRPGAVTLSDYNFKNPGLELRGKGDAERDQSLEHSDSPGRFESVSDGNAVAGCRTEEFQTARRMGEGRSSCHRLLPGRVFELTEHPTTAFNRRYLIRSVAVQGKQVTTRGSSGTSDVGADRGGNGRQTSARWLYFGGEVERERAAIALSHGADPLRAVGIPDSSGDAAEPEVSEESPFFECSFECLPADVPYRPARVTPRPHVRGTQTARVVGPQSEEIHTDPYGRVKVQFNWDREGSENGQPKLHGADSSCWIRVSQGMAGGAYGLMFLPRVGQEVVVDFLEGDPDQPIIIGRVYNADQNPPYELPAEKTKSVIKTHSTLGGGGSNEIRFEDLKNQEQILLHAQKDLHVRVKNDRVENVGHDRHLIVHKNKHELVKESKHVEVKLDVHEKVGGDVLLAVKGDIGTEVTGNHSEKVKNQYYLVGKELVIEAKDAVTIKAGGNYIKIDSSGVRILGTKVNINCSGGLAGVGSAVALQQWDPPLAAETITPGCDHRYGGTSEQVVGAVAPDAAGFGELPEESQQDTSWIEIELVDEIGQPVPNEEYEITAPNGEVIKKGHLDANGLAHVSIPEPGTCQVCFPNLDARAWEGA